jgi:hypothetical protein
MRQYQETSEIEQRINHHGRSTRNSQPKPANETYTLVGGGKIREHDRRQRRRRRRRCNSTKSTDCVSPFQRRVLVDHSNQCNRPTDTHSIFGCCINIRVIGQLYTTRIHSIRDCSIAEEQCVVNLIKSLVSIQGSKEREQSREYQ